jgi:peptidoglycan/LPS O-acetylase OafA/YrhL
VLLACLLPVGNVYLTFSGDSRRLPTWLPGYLDEFAIGMLLAVAVEVWPRISARRSRELLALAVVVGIAANLGAYHLGAPSPYAGTSHGLFAPSMDAAFALALASVFMRGENTVLGRVLSSRPLVAAGTISYGLYLWHMLAILQLRDTPAWWSGPTNVLLVLAGMVLIATASWILVERPALRLKNRPLFAASRRHTATLTATAVADAPD